jgi:glutamate dehydrogenase
VVQEGRDPGQLSAVRERARRLVPEDEADAVDEFIGHLYLWVPEEDMRQHRVPELAGAALSLWRLRRERHATRPGAPVVRAFVPSEDEHGWHSPHTVVQVITDDMPFLVDSVRMALQRMGCDVLLTVHPVIDGESIMHLEADCAAEPEFRARLCREVTQVLGDVRAAVEDWPAMLERTRALRDELDEAAGTVPPQDVAEARALLDWLGDGHFIFLGYREYRLSRSAADAELVPLEGTGLGILRGSSPGSRSEAFARLPPRIRTIAHIPRALTITKANARSTVHRPVPLDYIGVKRFDDHGRVIGERRLLGLLTGRAYKASPSDVPIVRRKAKQVLERAALPPGGHDEKALLEILETYPRDELFQIDTRTLFDHAMGILWLGERQLVRVFARTDEFERFVSFLVYLPRERFHTENRLKVQEILRGAVDGEGTDFDLRLTESVLVRLHIVVTTQPGAVPEIDVWEIEREISDATRSWLDDLRLALRDAADASGGGAARAAENGSADWQRFADAFPVVYRAGNTIEQAVRDIRAIDALAATDGLTIRLYRTPDGLRCRVLSDRAALQLSEVVPILEHMGVRVEDERPYVLRPAGGPVVYVSDFGLRRELDVDLEEVREPFEDVLWRALTGRIASDPVNGLILAVGLGWRDTVVLRAVTRYLRQAGTTFSDHYLMATLVAHPDIAEMLVDLFKARLDPERADEGWAERLDAQLVQAIEAVESLDEDRILRLYLAVIRATLRTNHFARGEDGGHIEHLALKVDSARIALLPEPRPWVEVFVYSLTTEGVHLRGGPIARGGLRWSDRHEDYRTEILGLMKAQMVKNALIVPVGAKGGFVVQGARTGGQPASPEQVQASYRTFVSALLDVTDNVVEGAIVAPERVVRHDGDDPYLVVAADKGTARLSDVANEIAVGRGFWLGDAFASGGSTGYDHKGMGITARGAWESVHRHFRGLGVDVMREDITVVGIGDMSGDVFGNGMLLSRHIRLVGAFDHRHVFLDPDPDAEAGFAERERLFGLQRSSWDDYDRARISAGGGVWPRTAKSIPVSPQARRALGIEAQALPPNDLIRAILRAPVDLLWVGGIGTYVKSSEQSHAEAGDRSNDPVRVNGEDLRCRVVGEGGNLGFTQRGRVEYALEGGRLNTDAIDNAGGVNCSDHEVNIKILLHGAIDDGSLRAEDRDALLAEMRDAVADRVIEANRGQALALALEGGEAPHLLDEHARIIRALESHGLDRDLEALPDEEELTRRRSAGEGLTLPELAVLLAYAKITLRTALVASDAPEDPWLSRELARAFPSPLPERFGAAMRAHRLRREIIATRLTNRLIDRGGTGYTLRLHEETGAPVDVIARASAAAAEVFALDGIWDDVERLEEEVAAAELATVLLAARSLHVRAARWLLLNRARPLDVAATVAEFAEGVATIAEMLPALLHGAARETYDERVAGWTAAGVPEALACRAAGLDPLAAALDVCDAASATRTPIRLAAGVHALLGETLALDWLQEIIAARGRNNRWEIQARTALRDDLYALRRSLTEQVLRSGGAEDPEELVDGWLDARGEQLERYRELLADVRTGGARDPAAQAVAVREVAALAG